MNTHPLLEVQMHLINGSTHRFIQNDPDLAHRTLSQINRKVFHQPSLVIYGENQAAVYQGTALLGISLVIEPLPGELLLLDRMATNTWELTEAEYQEKLRDLSTACVPGPHTMLTEIEMTTGRKLWIEHQLPGTLDGIDERKIVHQSFSLPSLVSCRRGGGMSLWNRAQMVSIMISPKPEVPSVAWPAERDEEPILAGIDPRAGVAAWASIPSLAMGYRSYAVGMTL